MRDGATPGTPSPAAGGRRPSRRAALTAAAGLVAAVAAVGLAVGLGSDGRVDPAPEPSGPAVTATPGPTPTASPSPPPTPTPTPTPTPATPVAPTAVPEPPADDGAAPPDQTVVPPRVVPELPPVPLTGEAEFGNEVVARMTRVERVQGEGQGLGEESGPALAVTVEMVNDTPEPVDLSFVVVNLADAAGNPGTSLFGDPRSEPFTGSVGPGERRTATYVLRLPADATTDVTVTVSYGAEAPTAVFSGPVPAG